jgi:hypothetical protein
VLEPCVSMVIATARLPDASLLTNGGSLSRPSRRRRSPGAKLRWANAPFSSSTPAGEALLRMTPSGILSFSRSSQRMPLSSTMSPRFNSFAATSTPSVVGGGGAAAICGGFDSLARTAAVIPATRAMPRTTRRAVFIFIVTVCLSYVNCAPSRFERLPPRFRTQLRGGPHKIGSGLQHSNGNLGLKRLFQFPFLL